MTENVKVQLMYDSNMTILLSVLYSPEPDEKIIKDLLYKTTHELYPLFGVTPLSPSPCPRAHHACFRV